MITPPHAPSPLFVLMSLRHHTAHQGDEVMYDCWMACPHIQAYMHRQGYGSDYSKLQAEYETRLLAIAREALPGRSLIMYQVSHRVLLRLCSKCRSRYPPFPKPHSPSP